MERAVNKEYQGQVAMGGSGNLIQERYRIVRLLGRGGFGSVYLAEDRRLGRAVALDAPAYLHNHRPPIIFRDLKPGNLMVARRSSSAIPDILNTALEDLVFKLIDFGIARFFSKANSDDWQVWAMRADGSQPRRLSSNPQQKFYRSWGQ